MKTGIIAIIKGYQNIISPCLPPACRFYPSCSQYAMEAIQCYGCLEGLKRAVQRLLRCHPFHPGGYDPAD